MTVVSSLKKIDVADRQDVFITCIYDDDEHKKHLRIILLDENECKAFSGYATNFDLISQAATIRMIFTDFMSLTIKALTKKQCDSDKFLYCMEKNCEGFIFKWKSVDQEETVIDIGSIKITESDYRSLRKEVFLLMSEEVENLKGKLEILQKDFSDLKKDVDNSLQNFINATDMKKRVEKELYSKFVVVLNEKKKEIRNLKRKTDDASLKYENKKQTNSNKWKKVHHISDSSDEGVSDPDNIDIAGPSTSKCNKSLLFFDEFEPQLSVSPSKKRNRSQCTAKNRGGQVNKSRAKPQVPAESESEDDLLNNL